MASSFVWGHPGGQWVSGRRRFLQDQEAEASRGTLATEGCVLRAHSVNWVESTFLTGTWGLDLSFRLLVPCSSPSWREALLLLLAPLRDSLTSLSPAPPSTQGSAPGSLGAETEGNGGHREDGPGQCHGMRAPGPSPGFPGQQPGPCGVFSVESLPTDGIQMPSSSALGTGHPLAPLAADSEPCGGSARTGSPDRQP